MALSSNRDVFITCALTGSGDTTGRSDKVPVTPEQIADAAIEAAKAGAAIAHIHVRDPQSGSPSRNPDLYRQVVELIRRSGVDVVLNLTAGMGGDLTIGSVEQPLPFDAQGTDLAGATERLVHIAELLPEICTLDCGTMNFGEGDYVMTNTPSMLCEMARQIQQLGVRPEIEVFDTGHLVLAKWLKDQGLIDDPVVVQLCMGIAWGAPDDISTFNSLVQNLPEEWIFSAFSIGRNQMPYVALAAAAGGNIRVGLEDNIWLEKGILASNGDLVEKAAAIATLMGYNLLTPNQVRSKLNLQKRWG
ncbi:MAG: 3-keto-5-aminohexanoate cleavage protein [Hyphomicrobiales bacterium]|nr:3-keto-5-aminohexanoate cleavage protein [Hyphomicrobiales bacterium]